MLSTFLSGTALAVKGNKWLSTLSLSSCCNILALRHCLSSDKNCEICFNQAMLPYPSSGCFPNILTLAHFWQRAHGSLHPFRKLEAIFKFYNPITRAKAHGWVVYDAYIYEMNSLWIIIYVQAICDLSSEFSLARVLPTHHLLYPQPDESCWEHSLNRSLVLKALAHSF